MVFKRCASCRLSVSLAASVAWFALASIPGAGPALADPWGSVLGFFGMGHDKTQDDGIDYSARPALVVPPKLDLPPPQSAEVRPADWPKDPDVAARRKAEADSRRPAPRSDSTDASSTEQAAADTAATSDVKNAPGTSEEACTDEPGKPICFYGPSELVNFAKNWNPFNFGKSDSKTTTLKVGVEPPREYLVQPPPGYRMPAVADEAPDKSQKATDPDGAAADTHDQNRKKVSADN